MQANHNGTNCEQTGEEVTSSNPGGTKRKQTGETNHKQTRVELNESKLKWSASKLSCITVIRGSIIDNLLCVRITLTQIIDS